MRSLTFDLGHISNLNGNVKEALKSSIFVVQKAAAPKTGVEFCQGSIGTRSSLARPYDTWRRHATSLGVLYVARLLMMVLIEPWRNSTPVFGAAAFSTTKIDDFRVSLTLTFLTISSPYSLKRRSSRWTSLGRKITEVTDMDQLKETNNESLT